MTDTQKISPALFERVKAEGVVRVIVQVRASSPEALAAAGPSARGLCANEACAKLRLRQSLPAAEAQSMSTIGEQPLVSMDVTEAGLDVLARSEFVERVVIDEPATTQPVEPDDAGRPEGAVQPEDPGQPERSVGPELSAPQVQ